MPYFNLFKNRKKKKYLKKLLAIIEEDLQLDSKEGPEEGFF